MWPELDLLIGFRTNAFGVVYGAVAKWIQTPADGLSGNTSLTEMLERLRPDERFESLNEFVGQMAVDEALAREALAKAEGTREPSR